MREKLNAHAFVLPIAGGNHAVSTGGPQMVVLVDDAISIFAPELMKWKERVHNLTLQRAAQLAAKDAEIAILREALEDIKLVNNSYVEAYEIAHAALREVGR
jgi:hypothetical protein